VCGGTLIASNKAGQLFSHAKYGDNNYDNKENCDWLILAEDDGYRVRFRFLTFEIEDERDCGSVVYTANSHRPIDAVYILSSTVESGRVGRAV